MTRSNKSWPDNKYRNDISVTLSLPAPPRAPHMAPFSHSLSIQDTDCAMFNTNLVKNTLHAVHKMLCLCSRVLSKAQYLLTFLIKFIPNDELDGQA